MKKLNKAQLEAVSSLACDIDELDNKPRRLFSSLVKFAKAFVADEEVRNEVIDSINQFEDYYYLCLRVPDMMSDVAVAARETKREMLSEKNKKEMKSYGADEQYFHGYENGVKKSCNTIVKKIINEFAEYNE